MRKIRGKVDTNYNFIEKELRMSDYSMNPEGEKFQLPAKEDYAKELQ